MLFNRVFKYEPPTVKMVGFNIGGTSVFVPGNWSIDLTNILNWTTLSSVGSVSANDLVIVAVSITTNSNTNAVPTILSSGWTLITTIYQASTGGSGAQYSTAVSYYRKVMGSTPDTSVSFTSGGDPTVSPYTLTYGSAWVFSNAVYDGATFSNGTDVGVVPSAITPTAPRSWVLNYVVQNGSVNGLPNNMTGERSFISVFNNSSPSPYVFAGHRAAYLDNWSSGSFTPGTWGGNVAPTRTWVSATIVLKPPF